MVERPVAGLFLDLGLGKTSSTLAALTVLFKKKLINKVLVLAPLSVAHNVWPVEVRKWADFAHLRVAVLHGEDKDAALQQDADIYVMNYEGLDWLTGATKVTLANGKKAIKYDLKKFKAAGFDVLVLDELSKCKSHKTSRFDALKQILPLFNRRYGLTGTPASNGLLDLFGQIYCLDLGHSLGQYITHYRTRYFFQPPGSQFKWLPLPGSQEAIYEKLRPLTLCMEAQDYLELPELVENDILIDLPAKAQKMHNEVYYELLTHVTDDEVVLAPSKGVAVNKCLQITSGAIYKNADALEPKLLAKDQWYDVHDAKIEALQDLVEELNGAPLLVAYTFKHSVTKLRKAFPQAVFAEDHPGSKLTPIIAAWNRGEIPIFFGHPASIGHGLNLQEACNHVCWFSLTYDLEHVIQFNKRVLRQGNKAPRVIVHRLVARKTIDEDVCDALRHKDNVQSALLAALKEKKRCRK